jgi:hypothetical protein
MRTLGNTNVSVYRHILTETDTDTEGQRQKEMGERKNVSLSP